MRKNSIKTVDKIKTSNILLASSIVSNNSSATVDTFIFNTNRLINIDSFISKDSLLEAVINQYCPSFSVSIDSKNLLISDKDFERAFINSDKIVQDYASKRQICLTEAYVDINEYIKHHKILVQPTGFAKIFNVASNSVTTAGCAIQTFWTAASAQVTGLSGSALIAASPLTVIAAPAIIGISLSYCECVSRGTFIAPVCHIGARVCLLPLKISEIVINHVILAGPNIFLDNKLIVNASDVVLNGFGIQDTLALSMIAKARESSGKTIRQKVINFVKNLLG